METFIFSDLESGTVTNNRSSLFKPVPDYKVFLDEFESCYDVDKLSISDKLFWIVSENEDGIILVINDGILSNSFKDDEDSQAMLNFMKENGNSDRMIEFMKNHREDLCPADIIEFIALAFQTITIQITDLEFGNSEIKLHVEPIITNPNIKKGGANSAWTGNDLPIYYLDLTKNKNWKELLFSLDEKIPIHQIYLDGNGIESLEEVMPAILKHKDQCWCIVLADNELTELPESFREMTLMKSINLRKNKLKTFPESIYEMSKLMYLNLSFNNISSISESLGNLKLLQHFILVEENEIEEIPNSLLELKQLKNLYLRTDFNKIKHIIPELKSIEILSQIFVTNESLNYVHELKNLPNLHKLDLYLINEGNEALTKEKLDQISIDIKKSINSDPDRLLKIKIEEKGAIPEWLILAINRDQI
jgi:hypothetical protein